MQNQIFYQHLCCGAGEWSFKRKVSRMSEIGIKIHEVNKYDRNNMAQNLGLKTAVLQLSLHYRK